MRRSGTKRPAGVLEAVLQNGTFVILRPTIVSRILLLEEIPP
jgi:hypothetical protein